MSALKRSARCWSVWVGATPLRAFCKLLIMSECKRLYCGADYERYLPGGRNAGPFLLGFVPQRGNRVADGQAAQAVEAQLEAQGQGCAGLQRPPRVEQGTRAVHQGLYGAL